MKYVKLIVIVFLWLAYGVFVLCQPELTNAAAVQQMDIHAGTYVGFAYYSIIVNYAWLALLAITIVAYAKEIKHQFSKFSGKAK